MDSLGVLIRVGESIQINWVNTFQIPRLPVPLSHALSLKLVPPVRLEPTAPRPRVKHSTTEPPRSSIVSTQLFSYQLKRMFLGAF